MGKKYVCFKCKTKFYDLEKPEPICPKCSADQREDPSPDPQELLTQRYRRPSSTPSEGPRPSRKAILDGEEEDDAIDSDVDEYPDPDLEDDDDDEFPEAEEEAEDDDEDDFN